LNGYSSGGKTGTAQKIDPATHTYSKSMHIASFAGFAPVNNPVVAIAVVMDNPKGKGVSYYGTAVSAPVFAEVAQQVLEYLGVPHDINVRSPHAAATTALKLAEDDAPENTGDVGALYAAANDLPSDDPLRANPVPSQSAASNSKPQTTVQSPHTANSPINKSPAPAPVSATVTVGDANTLRVPSLIGLSVRKVIEQAAANGLEVKITGNGTVREQAPAPGAMVPPGTRIVVRCGRPS
jgi:cell division protein FtsI (penicillin-binding protein 3)